MDNPLNVYNIIELNIDPAFPWAADWKDYITDLITLCAHNDGPARSSFRLRYEAAFSTENMRDMGDGFFIQSDSVLDVKYGIRLESSDSKTLILKANKPALEWFVWGMQLALLKSDATLVHCAAVEKDGKAILFPSWGGVGKTALVTEFVRSMNYKLLGDDLTIVDSQGRCFGLPKAMVLYAYHRPLFPEIFNSGRGPTAPLFLNKLLTHAAVSLKPLLRWSSPMLQFARRHNPQSVRVAPSKVFGVHNLSVQAQLEALIWLDRRANIDAPEFHEDDGSLPSRIMGSTLNEIDLRCIKLTNIAMGLGIIDASDVFAAWLNTLQAASSEVRKGIIYLPANLPVARVPIIVENILRQQGIIQ